MAYEDYDFNEEVSMFDLHERDDDYNVFEENQLSQDREFEDDAIDAEYEDDDDLPECPICLDVNCPGADDDGKSCTEAEDEDDEDEDDDTDEDDDLDDLLD